MENGMGFWNFEEKMSSLMDWFRFFFHGQGFSPTGALQARADAAALSRACRRLTTDADAGGDPFAAACQPIPPLLTHADEL